MAVSAKILLDSVTERGDRIVTMEVKIPRFILAELNTHRMLSRSSASSRAIPVKKTLDAVRYEQFQPLYWGKEQSGMQAAEEISDLDKVSCQQLWTQAKDEVLKVVERLHGRGLHKQTANRLLEPWLWHTVIVTATDWANFYALRCHPAAQPEMRMCAEAMRAAHLDSTPVQIPDGGWHRPYVTAEEISEDPDQDWSMISAARCARVSYLTHDGTRDLVKDIELSQRLRNLGHMAPFEHVATPGGKGIRSGNFRGWVQLRKQMPSESKFPTKIRLPWETGGGPG